MEAKIEKQNAADKIRNEKYREENQNRYQYKDCLLYTSMLYYMYERKSNTLQDLCM